MKTIRYGVIGLKKAGLRHIGAASANDNVELVALVDIDEGLIKSKATELGVDGFTDYRNMLDKGIVDAVSIATPNHLHYPIGLDCLNAGVHIFTEKPFTTRVSEADALIEMAKKKGLKIGVNYLYRTHRSSQLLKDHLECGAIGNIMRVLWTWGHFKPENYYTKDPWRGTFRHAGGGVLMSNASHELDLIRWLIGEPVEVSANMGNQLHSAEIEDMVCANVVFANGAFGSLQFTVNQPPAYSVRQIAGDKGIVVLPDIKSLYTDQHDQILYGTYGTPLSTMVHQVKEKPDPSSIAWQSTQTNGEQGPLRKVVKFNNLMQRVGILKKKKKQKKLAGDSILLNSFIEAILHGGEPLVNGDSARAAIEFINGIFLSAMRGKAVRFPLDPEEYDQLFEEMVSGKTKVPRFR